MDNKMTEAQAAAYKERRWYDIQRIASTLDLLREGGFPKWECDRQQRRLIDRCAAYKRDYG